MKQNKFTQLLISIAIVHFVAGCNSPKASQVTQHVDSQKDYKSTVLPVKSGNTKWLKQIVCRLPCFAGQTAGLTTFSKAQEFVDSQTDVVSIKSPKQYSVTGRSSMLWQWKGISEHIELAFSGITQTATLTLIRPTLMETMTLAELISEYGEPTHLVVSAGDSSPNRPNLYSFSYVYLNFGLAIHMGATVAPKKPTISKESKFHMVDIFEPSKEGYRNATGMAIETIDQLLIPWQGFRDFDFYCPQAYPKELERCKR